MQPTLKRPPRPSEAFLANKDKSFTIVSTDPGTTTCGFGLIQVDLEDLSILTATGWTIDGSIGLTGNEWLTELYSERHTRVRTIREAFEETLELYSPNLVRSESPFYNPGRPGSFEALLSVIFSLREGLANWSPWYELELIDPASAKKLLGVPGNSNDKDLVKKALLVHPDFQGMNIEELDEHSYDAVLIGWTAVQKLRGILPPEKIKGKKKKKKAQ